MDISKEIKMAEKRLNELLTEQDQIMKTPLGDLDDDSLDSAVRLYAERHGGPMAVINMVLGEEYSDGQKLRIIAAIAGVF